MPLQAYRLAHQPVIEDWYGAIGLAAGAAITGVFSWIIKREEKPKPKPIALQSIEVTKMSSEVLSSIIDDLQDERKQLRHNMNNLQMRFDALDARMANTLEKARSLEAVHSRNLRRLRDYAEDCQRLLQQAGVEPPIFPILESEMATAL